MTNDTKEAFSALGVSCGERIQHGIRRALSHAARWGCKSDWRSGKICETAEHAVVPSVWRHAARSARLSSDGRN